MTTPLKALVVEDSEDDFLLLVHELGRADYDPTCERVDTPEAFQAALARKEWDVVICDYTMPRFSGAAALELFRTADLDVPFLFVSGTLGEDAAVRAMKAGAHDYIMKGNMKRLLPAVERELREAEARRERARAEGRMRRQQERLRRLYQVNLAMTSTLDFEEVLNGLLEKTGWVFPHGAAVAVRLLDEKTGQLIAVASRNLDDTEWSRDGWGTGQSLSQLVMETKAPLMIHNVQENPGILDHGFFRRHGLISYLGMPLIVKDRALGVIGLYTREAHEFAQEEIDFLETLAGHAAMAIANARLYEQEKLHAKELENANRRLSELVGFAAHEIRTPLTLIMSCAAMLQEGLLGALNAAQDEAVAKVLRGAYQLLELAGAILEIGKERAMEVQVEPEDVHLPEFLADIESPYTVPLAKNITLIWDYSPGLPVIRTDGKKLKHILQNLINNAIQFTDHGSVRVSARHNKRANTIEFKVADTGRGIPAESLAEIFEMFQQVNPTEHRLGCGVGLGLYIARKYTEMLGGAIAVQSRSGEGTAFTVAIPCDLRAAAPGLLRAPA